MELKEKDDSTLMQISRSWSAVLDDGTSSKLIQWYKTGNYRKWLHVGSLPTV